MVHATNNIACLKRMRFTLEKEFHSPESHHDEDGAVVDNGGQGH
jgi:hypothetical protein